MFDEICLFLNKIDCFLIFPLCESLVQVAILAISNSVFYTILQKHLREACYFVLLAYCFGIFHMLVLSSVDVVKFAVVTSLVYGLFFLIAATTSKIFKLATLEDSLKILVFFYALICFRFYQKRDDFYEFLLTFIVMTVKLLCAGDHLNTITREELGDGYNLIITSFHVVSYVTYTPWISYRDFLCLRHNQYEKDCGWWTMMCSAGSRAILYKILSHDFLVVSNNFFKENEKLLIYAFQYRCKYYYRAQIAELEGIAVGVKKENWNKHYMFHFEKAESSILLKDFYVCLNLPVSWFVRRKFNLKNQEEQKEVLVNLACLLLLVASYDFHLALLWFLFMTSMYTQRSSMLAVDNIIDSCLFSCKGRTCQHTFGRNHSMFHFCKLILILINHFRFALLFVNLKGVSFAMSLRWTITGIVVDVILLAIVKMKSAPQRSPPGPTRSPSGSTQRHRR